MDDYELIRKILKKATDNGFAGGYGISGCGMPCGQTEAESSDVCEYTTFFNHDFAKAFWGDGEFEGESVLDGPEWRITLPGGELKHYPCKNWEYHLQIMVLEPEPLKYLEKFL